MSKKDNIDYYALIIEKLQELHNMYPQSIGRHLSNILQDYPNYWGLSDREFLTAVEKHMLELEENTPPTITEIERLIDDSSSIENLLDGIDDIEKEEDEN